MERFYKAQRSKVESKAGCSSETSTNAQKKTRVCVEFNPKEIIVDPGLRIPIEKYAVEIRDQVRREYLLKGPYQPIGHNYPRKQQGNQFRSFRDAWFLKFDWLEYSVEKDAAYCFYCYLFKHPSDRFGSNVFTISGFTNWKKAIQVFNEHVGGVNSDHNKAIRQYEDFKNQLQSASHVLSYPSEGMETSYKARLTVVLHVAKFLILQGLSFRSHDESSCSSNRGNFLEMLSWYEENVGSAISVYNENAHEKNLLTSPRVQEDLVRACVEETRRVIIDEIGDSNFFLLVDEVFDNSMNEHIVVIVRFVNNKGQVIERFLCLERVIDISSFSFKASLDSLFARHGLCITKLRGQGYNGASNMKEEFNELKALILNENPYAFYVHCFAHQLQLIIVSIAKNILDVGEFFNSVSKIVNIVGASCRQKDSLLQKDHKKIVVKLEEGEIFLEKGKYQETSFARRGDILWGSHQTTLIHFFTMWESLLEVLQIVCDTDNVADHRGMAYDLLQIMESFRFVFILHLMIKILGLTNELSLSLQQKDQNIINAMELIVNVKDLLQDLRENGWDLFMKEVKSFCNRMFILVPNMEDKMPVRGRSRREGKFITYYHHFHTEIFIAIIDLITVEMNNLFSETSIELLRCIACLDPRNSFAKFDRDMLLRLAEIYSDDFSVHDRIVLKQQLDLYVYHMRRTGNFSNCNDLASLAVEMVQTDKHLVFPLVYRLIELALILPVATATVERAFSAMNTIKTNFQDNMDDEWLNDGMVCSMDDERLNDRMVCYIEREIFKGIDDEKILQHFQNMQS